MPVGSAGARPDRLRADVVRGPRHHRASDEREPHRAQLGLERARLRRARPRREWVRVSLGAARTGRLAALTPRRPPHGCIRRAASAKDCAAVLLRKITQKNPTVTKHAVIVRAGPIDALAVEFIRSNGPPCVRAPCGVAQLPVAGVGVCQELRLHFPPRGGQQGLYERPHQAHQRQGRERRGLTVRSWARTDDGPRAGSWHGDSQTVHETARACILSFIEECVEEFRNKPALNNVEIEYRNLLRQGATGACTKVGGCPARPSHALACARCAARTQPRQVWSSRPSSSPTTVPRKPRCVDSPQSRCHQQAALTFPSGLRPVRSGNSARRRPRRSSGSGRSWSWR